MTERKLTGYHVAAIFGACFTVIIGVNIALAVNAVRTFPGIEVKNSYVASQSFDADRTAQEALGWEVEAVLSSGEIRLTIDREGAPARAVIHSATLGRATHVADDLSPDFVFDGTAWVAEADLGPGNWNLRLVAAGPDGTPFRQRIVVKTP